MINYSDFRTYSPDIVKGFTEVVALSGGRSSAYMLISLINGGLLDRPNYICFNNTGKEHDTCYRFLIDLQATLGISVIWLEYCLSDMFRQNILRPDFSYVTFNNFGYKSIFDILDIGKLQSFSFVKTFNNDWYRQGYYGENLKEVTPSSYSFQGEPFTDVFLYTCAIRIMKGKGLILPNAAQRWCTGEMKERVLHKYLKKQGVRKYVKYLGIRSDEAIRADRLFRKNDVSGSVNIDMPMFWMGVDKRQVVSTFSRQDIDLGKVQEDLNVFRDVLGNCTYCHLKSKIKKLFLLQMGQDVNWYKQVEHLVNDYNGTETEAMNRQHGRYAHLENLANISDKLRWSDVLSDTEVEMSCTGCGD